ncbi:Ctr-domain-containing protein [Tothia fuscella]|uniref:Copper transport protein n=1 Tax=Tothia fuscella TaxID=1048955 RepID=A0A9P4NIR8_9PEZI|nr:Ctr-domain-containing protein [Tothia fuscella]
MSSSMDMSMSMSMPMASSTSMSNMMSMTTGTAAAAATSAMSMGGMDMGGGNGCKISMLWNWYTIDTCFLSSSWHNTSSGMFAGSCIGVILLVILLEFLRRAGKEYDRKILRAHQQKFAQICASPNSSTSGGAGKNTTGVINRAMLQNSGSASVFRPNVIQQAIRALLHMLAFAVAYFVMLLAMYYNGYIIICIFIGAFLGFFIFSWESISLVGPEEETTTVCTPS